jgi:hypothetical protein
MTDAPRTLARELRISDGLCAATFSDNWIQLEADGEWISANCELFCEPEPTLVKAGWIPSKGDFGHGSDPFGVDCIVSFSWVFPWEDAGTIFFAEPRFEWEGHHLAFLMGKIHASVEVSFPLHEPELRALVKAFKDCVKKAKRSQGKCGYCLETFPSAHMADRGVCMGCATSELGTVF